MCPAVFEGGRGALEPGNVAVVNQDVPSCQPNTEAANYTQRVESMPELVADTLDCRVVVYRQDEFKHSSATTHTTKIIQ